MKIRTRRIKNQHYVNEKDMKTLEISSQVDEVSADKNPSVITEDQQKEVSMRFELYTSGKITGYSLKEAKEKIKLQNST